MLGLYEITYFASALSMIVQHLREIVSQFRGTPCSSSSLVFMNFKFHLKTLVIAFKGKVYYLGFWRSSEDPFVWARSSFCKFFPLPYVVSCPFRDNFLLSGSTLGRVP